MLPHPVPVPCTVQFLLHRKVRATLHPTPRQLLLTSSESRVAGSSSGGRADSRVPSGQAPRSKPPGGRDSFCTCTSVSSKGFTCYSKISGFHRAHHQKKLTLYSRPEVRKLWLGQVQPRPVFAGANDGFCSFKGSYKYLRNLCFASCSAEPNISVVWPVKKKCACPCCRRTLVL